VKNIDRSRVFTVVHDLIPLNDPFMGGDWRRLFLGKLSTSLGTKGNMIFVSESTRSLFHDLFPGYRPKRELVLYPSIPKNWVEQSSPAEPGGSSAYIAAISRNRSRERRQHIREMAARVTNDPETREELITELGADLPSWDGSLPYFATVTSDEPRKNIAIFVHIAKRFVGKANFIIIGQVDGNRYMDGEPELYPNLHFTGYLDDRRKADVMRHAAGVIFPSFAEGFGIPIVEGALFGVPVICSNLPVFHEVTRNLAVYFDPHSADELAARVNDLLANRAAYDETAWRRLREVVLSRFSQQAMQLRFQHAISEIGVG
jgi:glycosyltransferase involved in cell wall biosynthesis